MSKPKLAVYWAASCGGCDIAILDIEEKILQVADTFDVVFWPCAMDFKYADVEAMPDKSITLTLFNGAIRSDENLHLAQLLRRKSLVLCAFGSCAEEGGIPGLANLSSLDAIFDTVYHDNPSTDNPTATVPHSEVLVAEGTLKLPTLWNTVRPLGQVVDVDVIVPGCPPQSDQIAAVVAAVTDILEHDLPLPPPGSVLGATEKTCCDECPRERGLKKITRFVRPHEVALDPELCLLEQGILCTGPASRAGCGAKCVSAGVPCRGCYGRPAGVRDAGAKMLSALASVIDSQDPDEIDRIIATIPDLAGTIYRFGLADSMLRRAQV